MKIKNICIISYEYPYMDKMVYTFLEQLVNEFVDLGINCYVITPQSITRGIIRRYKIKKRKYTRSTLNNNIVNVYSPFYLSFSNKKTIINNNKINLYFFKKAANRIFNKLSKKIKFDLIYAHFIFPAGIAANEIGKKNNIPVFFAYGENTTYTIDYLGLDTTKKRLKGINGVISVSNDNKKILSKYDIIPEKNIKVFPNAINKKEIYKKNKEEMRKKLGFNINDFIIIFVGRFVDVKGPDRLCQALNEINDDKIKAIFIGSGDMKFDYKNIIFKGEVDHKDLLDYLSASDIFVLPTTSEGCCNAIIEALACGLPVISSSNSFNDDILNENCSLRIDSMNIGEIKENIMKLYKDEALRNRLSKGALVQSKKFDLEKRTKNIINFMEQKIKDNNSIN